MARRISQPYASTTAKPILPLTVTGASRHWNFYLQRFSLQINFIGLLRISRSAGGGLGQNLRRTLAKFRFIADIVIMLCGWLLLFPHTSMLIILKSKSMLSIKGVSVF